MAYSISLGKKLKCITGSVNDQEENFEGKRVKRSLYISLPGRYLLGAKIDRVHTLQNRGLRIRNIRQEKQIFERKGK